MTETLFEKIWNSHIVVEKENEPSLIYIDRHLIHEVTSPQAFDGLRVNHRDVRRKDLTVATIDHNVPTTCLLYTSPSPRDRQKSRMPSSA